MADKGPFLTSCIIFYLSVGAAIFQILEEPNWKSARDKYILQKENILKSHPCLSDSDLEDILEVVSEAAGQGVSITGNVHRNTWDWPNSVIFASTIVTTIGFGNVAPKTKGGRAFCILYGLCGIPLCLVWISELGSFFGDRAKRLSQVLIRKGVSVKKVQLTCTALFLLWGLLVHLLIPPFVFMSMEEWTYLEGIYYSFITLTTVGFGDYVAGVNPNIEYPRLYRVFAELWIYMGLAWLSLFFSWNVNMVVEAHKVLKKKRRQRNRHYYEHEEPPSVKDAPSVIDIFNFPKEEDYSTIIKEIGASALRLEPKENINRSKSCSDILAHNIQTLDHSPKHRRMISISEVFINPNPVVPEKERCSQIRESNGESKVVECGPTEKEIGDNCVPDPEADIGLFITVPLGQTTEEECVQHPDGRDTRFKICKVAEDNLIKTTTEPVKKDPDKGDQSLNGFSET